MHHKGTKNTKGKHQEERCEELRRLPQGTQGTRRGNTKLNKGKKEEGLPQRHKGHKGKTLRIMLGRVKRGLP
jgi:hypothetical protein